MDTLILICSIPLGIIFCTLLLSLFTYLGGKLYGLHFYSFEFLIFKFIRTNEKGRPSLYHIEQALEPYPLLK